jgi:hypothetical protein
VSTSGCSAIRAAIPRDLHADRHRRDAVPHRGPGQPVQRHATCGQQDSDHRGEILGEHRARRRIVTLAQLPAHGQLVLLRLAPHLRLAWMNEAPSSTSARPRLALNATTTVIRLRRSDPLMPAGYPA